MKKGVEDTLKKIPGTGDRIVSRLKKTKSGILNSYLFRECFLKIWDITYLGPVDGHDVKEMVRVFNEAKRVDHAVLVHVLTKKGKGYLPAEENPAKFHGIRSVRGCDREECERSKRDTYTEVFGKVLRDKQKKTSVSLRLRLRWRMEQVLLRLQSISQTLF